VSRIAVVTVSVMKRGVLFACFAFSVAAWVANALELTWLRPRACTLARMQLESWLVFGRAAALVAPVIGLLIGFDVARRSRAGMVALASNALVVVATVVVFSVHERDGWLHLPCLRE